MQLLNISPLKDGKNSAELTLRCLRVPRAYREKQRKITINHNCCQPTQPSPQTPPSFPRGCGRPLFGPFFWCCFVCAMQQTCLLRHETRTEQIINVVQKGGHITVYAHSNRTLVIYLEGHGPRAARAVDPEEQGATPFIPLPRVYAPFRF